MRSVRGLAAWVWPSAALALVAARLWVLQGDYPTGFDGGNWLLLGRMHVGLTPEAGGHSAYVYPPLVPLLMALGDQVIGGLAAARVLGVASVVFVMAAVYGMLVRYGAVRPWAAALASAIVGSTFPVVSRVCAGGFPQNFGLAFGIVGICAAARALEGRPSRLGAATLAGAALSHHAYYAWMTCALAVLVLSWRGTPGDPPWRVRLLRLLRLALPSLLAFAPTAVALVREGYEPRLNPGTSLVDEIGYYGFGPSGWKLLPMVALSLVVLRRGPLAGPRAVWHAAAALAATGLWSFAATYEPRLLAFVCAGAGLGTGLGLELWARTRFGRFVPLVALAATAAFLVDADQDARREFDRLRVVDEAYVQAAAWVDARRPQGQVFVKADPDGFPVGWWLAGLAETRVLAGCDARFLAFPRSRPLCAGVAGVFAPGLDWPAAAARARERGAALLVTRKADFPGWADWARAQAPAFENASWVAFDLSR